LDEREAIACLRQGDINDLAALVERYQVQAVRTAYLITHNRALAEDVAQAAFLRVYQRIHQYDVSRPFAPWFLRSVANAALQAAQKHERQVSLNDPVGAEIEFADVLPDLTPGPDAVIEEIEVRQAVWAALQQLTPKQRAAVVLRYYLDLSEQEIAAELDSPPGTIKWRLHTARQRLRGWLGELDWGRRGHG
jgi:RNA polymerase sigma-70 factor (ECF subfamily)